MFASTANDTSREDRTVWVELITRARVISSSYIKHGLSYEQGNALLSLAYSWDPSSQDWTNDTRKMMNDFKQDLRDLQGGDEAVVQRMKRDLETRQLTEDQPDAREQMSRVWAQWLALRTAVQSGSGPGMTEAELAKLSDWMVTMSPVSTLWGDGTWVDATNLGCRLQMLREGNESEKEESLKALRATIEHLALA